MIGHESVLRSVSVSGIREEACRDGISGSSVGRGVGCGAACGVSTIPLAMAPKAVSPARGRSHDGAGACRRRSAVSGCGESAPAVLTCARPSEMVWSAG